MCSDCGSVGDAYGSSIGVFIMVGFVVVVGGGCGGGGWWLRPILVLRIRLDQAEQNVENNPCINSLHS